MNPDGVATTTATSTPPQEPLADVASQAVPAADPVVESTVPVTDPVVVAATNLTTTLTDSVNIPDTASQDKVDYETKRLNDAIDGYNLAIPIQADFSALKAAQARAQALLGQDPSALAAARIQPRGLVLGASVDAIINNYDMSTYATDPLYEQKIRAIIGALPAFAAPEKLDVYIQTFYPGSPVTGEMVFAAAAQYGVDLPLLVAIMQNDSGFGTLGVGAITFNPGNVGNTGSATQTYPSWADGVAAVASWLNNHRVTAPPVPVVEPLLVPIPVPETPPLVSTTTEPMATSTPAVLPAFTAPQPSTSGTATSTAATTGSATTTPTTSTTATTTPEVILGTPDHGTPPATTATTTATSTPL